MIISIKINQTDNLLCRHLQLFVARVADCKNDKCRCKYRWIVTVIFRDGRGQHVVDKQQHNMLDVLGHCLPGLTRDPRTFSHTPSSKTKILLVEGAYIHIGPHDG